MAEALRFLELANLILLTLSEHHAPIVCVDGGEDADNALLDEVLGSYEVASDVVGEALTLGADSTLLKKVLHWLKLSSSPVSYLSTSPVAGYTCMAPVAEGSGPEKLLGSSWVLLSIAVHTHDAIPLVGVDLGGKGQFTGMDW